MSAPSLCVCHPSVRLGREPWAVPVVTSSEGQEGTGGGLGESRMEAVLLKAFILGRKPCPERARGPRAAGQPRLRLPVRLELGDLGKARCGLRTVSNVVWLLTREGS